MRSACTFAPNVPCITDLNVIVVDVDINGFFSLTFNDDEIVAGIFNFCTDITAQVSTSDHVSRISSRVHRGDRCSAGANGACTCQRSGSDNKFIGFIESLSLRRYFIPKDLIAERSAANPLFICRNCRDFACRKIDSETLTGPTVFFCIRHMRNL